MMPLDIFVSDCASSTSAVAALRALGLKSCITSRLAKFACIMSLGMPKVIYLSTGE